MIEKKYVITPYGAPVIFDKSIMHSEVNLNAVSAGFVKIWTDPETRKVKVNCFGESSSMGVVAHPDSDEKLIEDFLNA
jgi:hypothetical protein